MINLCHWKHDDLVWRDRLDGVCCGRHEDPCCIFAALSPLGVGCPALRNQVLDRPKRHAWKCDRGDDRQGPEVADEGFGKEVSGRLLRATRSLRNDRTGHHICSRDLPRHPRRNDPRRFLRKCHGQRRKHRYLYRNQLDLYSRPL